MGFEDKCIHSSKRFCAILAVDATGVGYTRINSTLDVFMRAQKLVEKHAKGSEVEFVWADKVAEHLNTTEAWKSLTTVFKIEKPDRKSENLIMVDSYNMIYKNFGGQLNKVTDLSEKEEDIKDFVVGMLDGTSKQTVALPSPLFQEPPPPPYTQEDITKMFVVMIVCAVAIAALVWSYITFKKEEAIKEEIHVTATKKKKKEVRDGAYGVGDD